MATVDIVDNTGQTAEAMHAAIGRALEIIGGQAETYAKLLCPVGTPESTGKPGYIGGTLRNSITHTADDKFAYIGTNVEYAPFVELGTVKMAAQPYLRPAAQEHQDEYKRIIESELHKG